MKTTKKWSKGFDRNLLLAGMAAMVLVFGLVVVGCGDGNNDNGGGGDGTKPYGNGSVTYGGKSYRALLTFTGKESTSGTWALTVPNTEDGTLSGSGTWTITSGYNISYTGNASGTGVFSNTTVTVIFTGWPIEGGGYASVVESFDI